MNGLVRRARSMSVFGIVIAGALGLIASTQTWIIVALADGSADQLEVAGATAIAVLAPLSLAALALGIALSIVGRVLRYVFAGIGVVIGISLVVLTCSVLFGPPLSAVAPAITDATGIAGEESLTELVGSLTLTAWPAVALVCWILLIIAAAFAFATAHTWRATGKKYRASSEHHATTAGPLDAVDSWDDLSRGDDPTR